MGVAFRDSFLILLIVSSCKSFSSTIGFSNASTTDANSLVSWYDKLISAPIRMEGSKVVWNKGRN